MEAGHCHLLCRKRGWVTEFEPTRLSRPPPLFIHFDSASGTKFMPTVNKHIGKKRHPLQPWVELPANLPSPPQYAP